MTLTEKYNLGLYKPFAYKDSGKTLTLADSESMVVGEVSGSLDFNGFPSLMRLSNGNILLHCNFATGHGADPVEGAGAFIHTSTDNGLTFGSRTKWWDSFNPPFALRGINPDVGLNDRIIVHAYDTEAFEGARVPWAFYSDDLLSTFSTPYKLTTDYDGDNRMADSTGGHLVVGSTIYKSLYGRTGSSGNRYMQLYKSVNNGESYSLVIRVPVPAGKDYEEVQLRRFSDGLWLAMMRTDTDKTVEVMYGYAEDVWSAPIAIGYSGWGRPTFDISPSGTLAVLGRNASEGGYANYMWSSNRCKTINTGLMSARETFQTYGSVMYVGAVAGVGDSCFLAVWAEDESFPSGPCKIYRNYFIETNS